MKAALRGLISLSLVLVVLLCSVSCGEYKEDGIGSLKFSVLKDMRKTDDEGYDICYTTLECLYGVQEITEERLSIMGLGKDATLEEATDAFMTRNGIDKSQCELTYDEAAGAYKFRYSVSFDQDKYYFHYTVIIGNDETT